MSLQPNFITYQQPESDFAKARFRAFVVGSNGKYVTYQELQANTNLPVAFCSMTNNVALDLAMRYKLDYYYLDSGYFGNIKQKVYLRLTKNACQNHHMMIDRPRDRLDILTIDETTISQGNSVLIVPPDDKVCLRYGLGSSAAWISETVSKIKANTDRPIRIRNRPKSRKDRVRYNTFLDELHNDVYVVVTYISNCAVEAVLHGIPAICLGPGATIQVYPTGIKDLDSLPKLNLDLVDLLKRHLSYAQFTNQELLSGFAWQTVNE